MPYTVTEERHIYRASRLKEIRCRLWYQVSPFHDGLYRHFLIWTEELE
jgi:hypothetical protein